MFTHRQYMSGLCTHHDYYKQLVEESNARDVVLYHFSLDDLRGMYEKDKYFNEVPPHKMISRKNGLSKGIMFSPRSITTWDILGEFLFGVPWKKYEDYPTLAGRVSVLKCAARMLIGVNE